MRENNAVYFSVPEVPAQPAATEQAQDHPLRIGVNCNNRAVHDETRSPDIRVVPVRAFADPNSFRQFLRAEKSGRFWQRERVAIFLRANARQLLHSDTERLTSAMEFFQPACGFSKF
jgi:hypothetical protein